MARLPARCRTERERWALKMIMKLRALNSLLDSLAKRNGQTAVLAFGKAGSVRWSYAELSDRIERLSAGLRAEGIGGGDNVALLADTSPEWIVASLAVIISFRWLPNPAHLRLVNDRLCFPNSLGCDLCACNSPKFHPAAALIDLSSCSTLIPRMHSAHIRTQQFLLWP
jgi:AMP-binding enzyme